MRAVVLVGGEGTRLRPLTLSVPKQMLPIVEQTMIERVLGHLGRHGIEEAVLSMGYLPEAFSEAYPDGIIAGIRVSYAVEPEPFDTAGAIRFAAEFVGLNETFVVVNGDILTDMDVSSLIEFHRERGAQGTIALHPVTDPSAFGVVPTDDAGCVTAFVEKPPADRAPTNEINAGTYVLEASFLDLIPPGRRVSIERETFPAMVAEGRLFARAEDSYWLDTGTPGAYLQAHRDLLNGVRDQLPVEGAREISDALWVRGNPEISGTVSGGSFVADGAKVAHGAEVVGSVLGAGSIVEEGATVVGSVLMAGARVASHSHVDTSILGRGAVVENRCVIRTLSVIGSDMVISAGTVLDGDRVPS